jgi:hypothetical protein
MVGMVGVGGYAYLNGDPMLLLTTWDYDGNPCGYPSKSNATIDYPYLYFPAIDYNSVAGQGGDGGINAASMTELLKYSTCVKECPSATSKV